MVSELDWLIRNSMATQLELDMPSPSDPPTIQNFANGSDKNLFASIPLVFGQYKLMHNVAIIIMNQYGLTKVMLINKGIIIFKCKEYMDHSESCHLVTSYYNKFYP